MQESSRLRFALGFTLVTLAAAGCRPGAGDGPATTTPTLATWPNAYDGGPPYVLNADGGPICGLGPIPVRRAST